LDSGPAGAGGDEVVPAHLQRVLWAGWSVSGRVGERSWTSPARVRNIRCGACLDLRRSATSDACRSGRGRSHTRG